MRVTALGLLLLVLAVACSSGPPEAPSLAGPGQVTESAARALLTTDDLANVGADAGGLDVSLADRRADAEAVNPAQVAEIESWYATAFQQSNGGPALFFSIIDFASVTAAQSHMDLVESGQGYTSISPPIGDRAILATPLEVGIGSALVFAARDRVVLIHTTTGETGRALVSPDQVTELARMVADRL